MHILLGLLVFIVGAPIIYFIEKDTVVVYRGKL